MACSKVPSRAHVRQPVNTGFCQAGVTEITLVQKN
jgi:hypothetical protein